MRAFDWVTLAASVVTSVLWYLQYRMWRCQVALNEANQNRFEKLSALVCLLTAKDHNIEDVKSFWRMHLQRPADAVTRRRSDADER